MRFTAIAIFAATIFCCGERKSFAEAVWHPHRFAEQHLQSRDDALLICSRPAEWTSDKHDLIRAVPSRISDLKSTSLWTLRQTHNADLSGGLGLWSAHHDDQETEGLRSGKSLLCDLPWTFCRPLHLFPFFPCFLHPRHDGGGDGGGSCDGDPDHDHCEKVPLPSTGAMLIAAVPALFAVRGAFRMRGRDRFQSLSASRVA
jgi:hypothetical protein